MDVNTIFLTWELPPDVLENLINNGIEISHFKDLINNEAYLKEICPHIGHRIKLKSKIQEYLDSVTDTETTVSRDDLIIIPAEEIHEHDPSLHDISFDLDPYLNIPSRSSLPEFDLKTILQSTPHGNSVLNYYKTHKHLNSQKRNIIVDILVKYHYTFIVNNNIKPEELNLISAKIVALFPTESIYTYYMKAVPTSKSSSGRYVPAKGKLVDKVRNLLHLSGTKRRRTQITGSSSDLDVDTGVTECQETILNDDVIWLKHNSEPWTLVIEKWKNTFNLRRNQTCCSTVHEFLETWSILKQAKGDTLILMDFEELFKEKSLNFHKNWEAFFLKVLGLRQEIVINEEARLLIESLESTADNDKKIPVQVYLLGYLIPPKGRKSRKVKYSTTETIEGLLIQTNTAGDIDSAISKRKKKAADQGDTVQPYVLIQGPLHNFSQIYIVIDDVKYHMQSAAKAFDLLFKLYHVFHAKYPRAAEYLYLIVQKKVFNINTVYDSIPPYIIDILNLEI